MIAQIWTIGHSTREIDKFISALEANGIKLIADVRSLPGSKRYPQFNRETLAKSLSERGIGYEHFPELGGRRKPKPDSPNTAWRNAGFRGFADYMQTPEFAAALAQLIDIGQQKQTAIMCAEAVPWRCHRSLVADALTARGVPVEDILSPTRRSPHKLTPFVRVEGTRVWYPGLIA